MRNWIRDRALTLVLLTMFVLFLAGRMVTGHHEYNATQAEHGHTPVTMAGYLATGQFLEALFENWGSEFLAIASMVWLAVYLSKGGRQNRSRPRRDRSLSVRGGREAVSSRHAHREGDCRACMSPLFEGD